MAINRWTREEEEIIVFNKNAGKSYTEIQELLPHRGYHSVRVRGAELVKRGLIKRHNHTSNKIWSDNELLVFVKKYRTANALRLCEDLRPSPETIRNRFGSWTNALKLCGLKSHNCGMKPNKLTTLYLVKFTNFYKIGLTQGPISQRFSGYDKYKIIDQVEIDYLEEALKLEKFLLNKVRDFKTKPENFRGSTECFTFDTKISSLDDIVKL